MKRLAKFLSIVICLCLLVGTLAACTKANHNQTASGSSSSSDSSSQNSNADSSQQQNQGTAPKKIKYLSARMLEQDVNKSIKYLVDEYKAQNPGFEFEFESISDRPAYLQKVKILAAGNELPDWFDADPEPFFAEIAKKGLVANIEELYEELGVADKFFKISKDYPKLDDGSLYLITWQGNTEYFWYNKDLFAKVGVTPPTTFDEFLNVCKALKEKNITPISVHGKDMWPPLRYLAFLPFRYTGNEYIDKLRKGEVSMGDDVGLEAAKFVQEIGKNYFMEGWANADYNTSLEVFLSGKAAMYYMGTWQVYSFVDENMELKEPFGYFRLPKLGNSDVTSASDYWANSGIGTAIRKDSLDDAMKSFLKYVFDNYANTALYKFHYIPSMRPDIKDDLPQIYKDIINDLSNVNTFGYCWDVRVDPATNEVLGKETINLAMGVITPEEYAKRIDAAIKQNAPKFFK